MLRKIFTCKQTVVPKLWKTSISVETLKSTETLQVTWPFNISHNWVNKDIKYRLSKRISFKIHSQDGINPSLDLTADIIWLIRKLLNLWKTKRTKHAFHSESSTQQKEPGYKRAEKAPLHRHKVGINPSRCKRGLGAKENNPRIQCVFFFLLSEFLETARFWPRSESALRLQAAVSSAGHGSVLLALSLAVCVCVRVAEAQAARSSLRDRSAPPPGPYSHILPAGTRGYISSQACALLCVSAPQPRQHSDREAEGRPESGQRRKGRERGYSG